MAALPAGAPLTAVYQPLNDHLEVFVIDADGALTDVWKAGNGPWSPPLRLSSAGLAEPGASLAAVYYPTYEQLEVFVVDKNGVLNVIWKAHDGAWNAPIGLTQAGFAPSGSPLAAVYQPLNEHLEVLLADANGALNVVWKAFNGGWSGPFALPGAGGFSPRAALSAVYYPGPENLELFGIAKNGTFNVIWKQHDGAWNAPVALTQAGFAPAGAPLAAVYQPLNEHLEVFVADANGALNVIWKAFNGPWSSPYALPGADAFSPRTSLAAVYYPGPENLELFGIARDGGFAVIWKQHDGAWNPPVGVTERHFLPGAPLSGVYFPPDNHLEVFTSDQSGALNVEWKVQNRAWVPCSYPIIMGTSPGPPTGPVTVPTVLRTERLGQLTGDSDPDNLPVLNGGGNLPGAGVRGVDLGASAEHQGRLYFFFGDVPKVDRNDGPAPDADLVGWTADTALRPGGFTLEPVKSGQFFDPFTVDSGVGYLPRDRTPTGAFSYSGRVYVFGLWDDPATPYPGLPTTILASKEDPSKPGPYHLEFTFSRLGFWQVAPVVVRNVDHPGLPEQQGDGLVLLGGGGGAAGDAVHLAWMRLDPNSGPVPSSTRYFTGKPGQPWTPAENDPASALRHEPEAGKVIDLSPWYTAVSAAWLADARQWIILYGKAVVEGPPTADRPNPRNYPTLPVVARLGSSPWSWSDEVELFKPCRDGAYGHFMHWGGLDDINHRVAPDFGDDLPGWAYGAFFMQRFSAWNAASRELSIAYLMSPSRPYQVEVMRTQLRLPPPPQLTSVGSLPSSVSSALNTVAPTALPKTSVGALPSSVSNALGTARQYQDPTIVAGWPQLSLFTQGDAVRSLQYLLTQHGAAVSLGVDGKFGAETNQAVLDFQKAQGLSADGIVGPTTWQALIVSVQSGSQGPAVQAVQSQLGARGMLATIDGDFGNQTDAAVRTYQQTRGLTVDGQVGPQTWQALLAGR